ncbi:MAG: apolipoprotein N-acyltransferase, partial [Deltaproteobacteria bacterium]
MFDRKRISCAVLSGVLLTLSFPTPSWFFLAWLAMVPLMFSIESCSYRQSFLLGWFAGFVHFTSLLYWIYYVVNHYGKV